MADRVHILGGDELDQELLAEALGRTGISDYAERGLDIRAEGVDFAAAVADVPAGKAFILDNGRDTMLLADARAGVELATDGVNHVFIYYDLNQAEGERIDFHVSQDGSPPSFPALEIAVIDMAAGTVDRPNHTAPIYHRDAETYKGNDLDPDGDGRVAEADEAFLVQGTNVTGAVAEAEYAATADTATTADQADNAANADGLGANGPVTSESQLDLGGHLLGGVVRANIRDGGKGADINVERVNDRQLFRLTPVDETTDGARFGDELVYSYNDRVWDTNVPLRSEGSPVLTDATDINAQTLGADGIVQAQNAVEFNEYAIRDVSRFGIRDGGKGGDFNVIRPDSGGQLLRLTPVDEATDGARFDDEIVYSFGERTWHIETPFEVTKGYLGLPARNTRPADAPNGAMIYRSDK